MSLTARARARVLYLLFLPVFFPPLYLKKIGIFSRLLVFDSLVENGIIHMFIASMNVFDCNLFSFIV